MILLLIIIFKLLLKALELDEEYLKTIAKYIDDTACAIHKSNPHFSDKNILILTALNIADMLHKKQIEIDRKDYMTIERTSCLHDRMKNIIDMLEAKTK